MRSEHRAAQLKHIVSLVLAEQFDALRSHFVVNAVVRNGVLALHQIVQEMLAKVAKNALHIKLRKQPIDLQLWGRT